MFENQVVLKLIPPYRELRKAMKVNFNEIGVYNKVLNAYLYMRRIKKWKSLNSFSISAQLFIT